MLGGITGACLCGSPGCSTLNGHGDTRRILAPHYRMNDYEGVLIVALEQVPELGKIGGSVKIEDDNLPEPIIIARIQDEVYVAASIKCRHGGREVEYKHADGRFRCVSFGHSVYDLDGKNVRGPAKKPLAIFPVSVHGASLSVKYRG